MPQLVPDGLDSLPAYTEKELHYEQLKDRTLSRVLHERRRRPSRTERAHEAVAVMKYMKHWEKLVLSNGILYRLSNDQVTKFKRSTTERCLTKGSIIAIGDRVIVANKKERGKRKVADRWESTVYTVVDRNNETHTCKIQDTTSSEDCPLQPVDAGEFSACG